MKKLFTKLLILICAVALSATCAFALVACDSGEKFTYSGTDVKITESFDDIFDDDTYANMLKTTYNNMYKGSTITVSDTKLTWTIQDNASVLTVKRDGDKYILAGDFVNQFNQNLAGGSGIDQLWYGIKTDAGFNIVMEMTGTIITISFTK